MISFENIKTGEVVTFSGTQNPLTRQAHMAAYLNSSNMSPNALKGQDFGWRLAPEVVDRIEAVKGDLQTLTALSRAIGVPIDELKDFHILNYIAEQEFAAEALRARQSGESSVHEQSYEERVRALRARREQPETYQEEPVVAPRPVKNPGELAQESTPPVEVATTVAPEPVDEQPEQSEPEDDVVASMAQLDEAPVKPATTRKPAANKNK